jgi:hypothetical protein
VNWLRSVLGRAVPMALVAAGAGSVLAAAPAIAAARGPAAPSCTVNWIGSGFGGHNMWTKASDWSTGKVPGPNDDVCIGNNPAGTGVIVLTPVSIAVHSLQIGASQGIAFQGTASNPVTATVATGVTIASGGRVDMTDATVKAPQISNQGGTIGTDGTCSLTSPGITFGAGGSLQAFGGTTTLTSLADLSNGTLTGAGIQAASATVVVPGDIANLASANISVGVNSAIDDPAGHNALAGLSMIDKLSSLTDDNNLTLTGSDLVAYGNVTIGGTLAVGGPFTQVQSTLTLGQGTTLSASPVTIDRQAGMLDEGTISGDLVNSGNVTAYGHVNVTGNYIQTSNASLTTGFSGAVALGGLLQVAGTATLAGSVSATEVLAKSGDTSQLITFGSLSGGFTSHSLGLKLVTKANEIDGILLPQIAVSPKTVTAGHAVTVTAGGFTYPKTVSIFLDKASGTPLATANVGLRGTFAAAVIIPASTGAGSHRLIAVESDGFRASASIKVR